MEGKKGGQNGLFLTKLEAARFGQPLYLLFIW